MKLKKKKNNHQVDRDKVMKGLEVCIDPELECKNCPYVDMMDANLLCAGMLMKDSLDVLRTYQDYYLNKSAEMIHSQESTYANNLGFTYQNDACTYCSSNPKNGGSGICNCILGLAQVTC